MDFSLLVFKIVNDRASLLHYLDKAPDLIAFSEYSDSYNRDPEAGFKFETKQLNWLTHAYEKAQKTTITVQPMGLDV